MHQRRVWLNNSANRCRKEIVRCIKASKYNRLVPTLVLVAVVLLASWMGYVNGGYFVSEWTLVALILSVLALVASVAGALRGTKSWLSTVALGLFAAYTAWTFASLLWSPN